jgi:ADP-heptose:LPS heptosyltransferase
MRILALQLKRIGDLILTTPALWALRQNLPKAHIVLAIEGGSREMLPAIDYVDDVLVHERHGQNRGLWRHLLFRHYDLCLDFTGTDRSALFAVLSKASRRVTFEWVQRSRFRHVFYNQFIPSSVRENHTVDHYLHLLRAINLPIPSNAPIVLHLPEWAPLKARQLLVEAGITDPSENSKFEIRNSDAGFVLTEGGIPEPSASREANSNQPSPFILVHPGTARPEKYWLPERWAEVIEWCESHLQIPCVLAGSADGHEQSHLAAIKRGRPSLARRDLSGRLDLLTLAALTRMAALVLTVDSAPMHLAAAFGVPQVALFGPTNPFHWRPRHDRAIVLQSRGPSAPPEFRPQHPGGPMTEISTQVVIDAIVALHVHA